MRRISVQERRARLALRHRLAGSRRSTSVVDAARSVVVLHGTDPATVFLSAAARIQAPTVEAIERALYEDRELIRMLGMRRTVFVVPVELAAVVQAACTNAIAARERRTTLDFFGQAGFAEDIELWLSEVEASTMHALLKRGEATAVELAQDEPRLKQQLRFAEGKTYEGVQSASTRILMGLAADGKITRARPKGSWISSQFRWAPIERWLPNGFPDVPIAEAQAQLVRCWLQSFGPGSVADLRWWTGLTAGDVKRALASLGAVEVDMAGSPGLLLPDDLEPVHADEQWVALLPALDPTPMGWSQRDWFLGEHAPLLFDRSGNIAPTVWCDGRVVGGWAQCKSGEISLRLFEDVGRAAQLQIEAAAEALRAWIGPVRVTPRFRTPLDRELTLRC
jgi:hypothetical protein